MSVNVVRRLVWLDHIRRHLYVTLAVVRGGTRKCVDLCSYRYSCYRGHRQQDQPARQVGADSTLGELSMSEQSAA